MKSFTRWILVLVAAALFAAHSLLAQTAATSVARIEIKHVGPASVNDELIRSNIRVKAGDSYVRASVDDDVKNLYATGYFYNIQVATENTDAGVVLTYVVQGKPRLTAIKYSGNQKYGEAKISKKVTSKVGEPLDEQKLFSDAQAIKKLYSNAGYPQTEAKYVVSIDEAAGTGSATFEIEETPKVKIDEFSFDGADSFPHSKLRKLVKIRKPGLLSSMFGQRTFKADKLIEGKEKLYDFYREQGYIDFEIKDVQLTYPTPTRVLIKIAVSEGKPYKLGAITIKGNTLVSTDELIARFPMKVGDTFTPKGLTGDSDVIKDFYGSRGYIDVDPDTGKLRVQRVPNTDTGTMDLAIEIEEGQKVLVEKIEIHGNAKTKDRVIRRELAVTPGETFDMTRVKLSKTRLDNLNYFEKVEASPDPTDIPNRKNLLVEVEEKSTGNISLGAGFSSVDSFLGFAEVSQGNFDLFNPPNFTGGGQKARLKVQLGAKRQDYELGFVEPWFLGRKLSLGVDMYHRQLDFQSVGSLYNESRTGARVSLTRALGSDFLIGSVNYTIENVGIDSVPTNAPASILAERGDKLLHRFGGSLAYDTRRGYFDRIPTRGQRSELSGEFVTGGAQFYKVEAKTAWYVKGPFEGHILELVARTGIADSLGGGGIPFYEKFYLGGLYSLRGYEYRSVGPQEAWTNYTSTLANGTNLPSVYTNAPGGTAYEPVGGNTYWFASAEYTLPLIDKLRFAMFYDIGGIENGTFDYKFSHYTDDIGIGLRLNLPIGPLRLDYAFPIQHDPGTGGSGRFQFGVGYTREF
ncbi:MAG: hypothetical protein RL380_311 [Verrucomicrobiota bacterium]|jgi:outer membrane protein insertion porin family